MASAKRKREDADKTEASSSGDRTRKLCAFEAEAEIWKYIRDLWTSDKKSDERDRISNVVDSCEELTTEKALNLVLGYLRKAWLSECEINLENMAQFKVKNLKNILRAHRYQTTGRKDELCRRIAAHVEGFKGSGMDQIRGRMRLLESISREREVQSEYPSHAFCRSIFVPSPRSEKVRALQIWDRCVSCDMCSQKYISLDRMAVCRSCNRVWHVTCAGLPAMPTVGPPSGGLGRPEPMHASAECFTCRCKSQTPMLKTEAFLAPTKIVSKRDAQAAIFSFNLNGSEYSDAERRPKVYVRLFPVVQNDERYKPIRFDNSFGLALNIDDKTYFVRNGAQLHVTANCTMLQHVNGDVDVTPHMKFDSTSTAQKHVIRLALSSTGEQPFRQQRYICSIQSVRPLTEAEYLKDIPRQTMEEGKAWIQNFFNAKGSAEVSMTHTGMSLRCPLSRGRLSHPARGKHCKHLQCFDVYTFLQFNRNVANPKCPLCNTALARASLQICGYTKHVLDSMEDLSVEQAIILPDGSFRSAEKKSGPSSPSPSPSPGAGAEEKKGGVENVKIGESSTPTDVISLSSDEEDGDAGDAEENPASVPERKMPAAPVLPPPAAFVAAGFQSGNTLEDAIVLD